VLAAALSGAPSTLHALIKGRSPRAAVVYVYDAMRAVGTLVPPGRPGFGRGMVVHLAISMLCGEALARTLPREHPAEWGAAAGFVIGVVNVGVIGRSFPAIRAWLRRIEQTPGFVSMDWRRDADVEKSAGIAAEA